MSVSRAIIVALCILLPICGCGAHDRKVTIKKVLNTKDRTKEKAKDLDKLLQGKECLPLKEVLAHLGKKAEESYTVYTHAMELGTGGSENFAPEKHEGLRGRVLLQAGTVPLAGRFNASQLDSVRDGLFAVTEQDENCTSITFKRGWNI